MEAKKPTLLDVFHSFTGGKTEMELFLDNLIDIIL